MDTKKAIIVSLFWVFAALVFNAWIYFNQGQQKALEFLTGYLVELSLSVDNIFVFLVIFKYFKCTPQEQARILRWGVWGAIIMRLVLILVGLKLIHLFDWLLYILGAFLIFTGIKLFIDKEKDIEIQENKVLQFCQKHFPKLKQWVVIVIIVELTDLMFALDSIPAIFAITKDPFIVWTSNIFAIIGLRAMYFALAGIMPLFTYLHYALGAVLVFVGMTMVLEHIIHIPTSIKLYFIGGSLGSAVVFSILKNKRGKIR